MFQNLFLQMHQTLDQINHGFDKINNIDEELFLLEKYLSIKEISEVLTEELKNLNLKLSKIEKDHGLLDIYPNYNNFDNQDYSLENIENLSLDEEQKEEVVFELFEEDLMTFQKGIGFYDLSMHDKAIVYLENIIEKYPDFNLARLYTAMAYLKRKDFSRARQEIQLLFRFSDDEIIQSLAHNILGIIYGHQFEYEQAILHFQQAIDLKENWKEPKYNLAIIYYKLNQFTDAIILFEELFSFNPKDWEVILYLGKCYQKLKQYDRANWYFNETYTITKKPIIIKQIALYYERHNQFQKAIYWYKKWLRIEPKQTNALLGLAKNIWLRGDKKTGIALIKKALTLETDNIEVLLIYAWMLTDNNSEKAHLILERISKHIYTNLDGFDLYMVASLARLYYLNNDKNVADEFCRMLLNADNDLLKSLGNIVMGLIYLDEKKPNEALIFFDQSVKDGIKFPYIDFYIGYSHYLLGNVEAAKNTWGNLLKQK